MLRVLMLLVLLGASVLADAPAGGLQQKLDTALAKVRARPLLAERDTPWVIMHAAIAFERDTVVTRADGSTVNAIEFLLSEAKDGEGPMYYMDGQVPRIRTRDISPGFKASFILQDHVDQFLFCYADAGVPLDQRGRSGDTAFTVRTLLDASLAEFKPTQELGWTLVVTSHYLPIDHTWKTDAGVPMSTAEIVALAVKRDANRETEGGTHHLYGIAYALSAYVKANPDKELQGPWAEARAYLDRHVELAKKLQNPDGSFSSAIFRGQQVANTPAHLVWSTGHMIEWLCLALPPEELAADWMSRAANRLADELLRVDIEILSMGGLYHAAHALRLYRERTAGLGAAPDGD